MPVMFDFFAGYMPGPYKVYELLLNGRIVYIGSTHDLPGRMSAHQTDGKLFDAYRCVSAHWTEAEARNAERIHLLSCAIFGAGRPVYNQTWHG